MLGGDIYLDDSIDFSLGQRGKPRDMSAPSSSNSINELVELRTRLAIVKGID